MGVRGAVEGLQRTSGGTRGAEPKAAVGPPICGFRAQSIAATRTARIFRLESKLDQTRARRPPQRDALIPPGSLLRVGRDLLANTSSSSLAKHPLPSTSTGGSTTT